MVTNFDKKVIIFAIVLLGGSLQPYGIRIEHLFLSLPAISWNYRKDYLYTSQNSLIDFLFSFIYNYFSLFKFL